MNGRRLRFTELISGWINGVAELAGWGAKEIDQDPYDPVDNPDGWTSDRLATCGWTDERLEKLIPYFQALIDKVDRNSEINLALYYLLQSATEAEHLEGPTVTDIEFSEPKDRP